MAELNKTCCSLPAITTHNYTPKGTWQPLGSLSVYTICPPSPKFAVIAIYDIFGAMPQTTQGCDLLSAATGALVLMPDFFKGEPLPLNMYPVDTDEKKERATEFMKTKAATAENGERLQAVIADARDKAEWKGLEWAGYGLCWGGKIIALASGEGSVFKASGQAHPGMLAVEDAKAMRVPHICLFSKGDGTPELCEEYEGVLKEREGNVVEKYGTMIHGWMGARADFENGEVVREFEGGYTQLADFFSKHVLAA